MVKNKTMSILSYGICNPYDLLNKMKHDGKKIEPEFHRYDIFNFIITSAVLGEWIGQYYGIKNKIDSTIKGNNNEWFPEETISWIKDHSNIPNPHYDLREQIQNSMQICHHICNASKHFKWKKTKITKITSIDKTPIIKGWYQYFFTKIGPGVYIEFNGIYYCITQIRDILIQFYEGLIPYLESKINNKSGA